MNEYLKEVLDFPNQLRDASRRGKDIEIEEKIDHVVIAGMGGSISSGMFLQNYIDLPVQITLDTTYSVSQVLNKHTLFFALSHSGNTEETLSSCRAALRKGAQVIVITSGGKLEHLAHSEGIPIIKMPSQLNSRTTLAYFLLPILNVLATKKIILQQDEQIRTAIEATAHPLLDKRAKELAKKLIDKTPLIYTSQSLSAIAYWWKIRFNDNSKVLAFCNTLPEALHNEIAGFEHASKEYYAIFLYDEEDPVRMKESVRTMKNFISEKGNDTTLIALNGTTKLSRILSLAHLGALTSIYLAEEEGRDAESNDVVEKFKKRTQPSV